MKQILACIFLISVQTIVAQKKAILFTNTYLHIGNGEVMESAAIGIRDGKIDIVRNALAYTFVKEEWDTVIDLKGQHTYPGFIAPNTTLGLTEIDAVRATRDFSELGEFNPHIRSQIAYNVESDVISSVLTNGVLLCQPTPRGGIVCGTSSVMRLTGWNWEDATVSENDGIHVNWPIFGGEHFSEEKYAKRKAELIEFFTLAQNYSLGNSTRIDGRLEAMKACFDGKKRVYFRANSIQEILDVIAFSQYFKLPFPVLVGGYQSYLVTQQLKDAKIPVMLNKVHSLPLYASDPIDLPYKLPFLLQKAGVLCCLQNEGDMEAMHTRNLPFLAGTAVAYGLTVEQAIAMLTSNTAKIMGIDEQYGTISVGKSATFFVSKGNALDMQTSQVTYIVMEGNMLAVTNRQLDLFEKYKSKYSKN